MAWLNYHHLLYFWTVARAGSVARACQELHLSQPTVSEQIRALEKSLGEKLFERSGRHLVLTDSGRTVFRFADEIFSLGREMVDTLSGRGGGKPWRLVVGVTDAVPKRIVHRLLEPALHLGEPVQVVCREAALEPLLAELALFRLDLVLAESPAGPAVKVRAFNHLLGECPMAIVAAPKLAARLRRRFPQSLHRAPLLLPAEGTSLRRALDDWFEAQQFEPIVAGEFDDMALLEVFGQAGHGAFAVPAVIERQVCREYQVRSVGQIENLRERYYAISVERKLKHPAVVAITAAAREQLFAR